MSPNETKPTRNQQREEARAKAKALREQHKKEERRKRLGIRVGVIGVVAAALAIIVVALVSGGNSAGNAAAPSNFMFNDGIKIGAGVQAYTPNFTPTPAPSASATPSTATVPNIIMYLDYQCPICQQFESANAAQLKSWVNTGAATLEIHPISFLDSRASLNEYSSRAANAAICVAQAAPNSFFDYSAYLYEHQPAEGTAGPSNDDLVADLAKVQISATADLTSCIKNKKYGVWVSNTTSKVLSTPIPGTKQTVDGTPYVLVNGHKYTWNTGQDLVNPARFAQFVQSSGATQ